MVRHPRLARAVLGLAVALVVVLGSIALDLVPLGHAIATDLDATAHDAVVSARPAASYLPPGSGPASDPRNFITIVAIDERTIGELGAYNGGYPRAYHAQVIEQLLKAPPRVIAVDLGFFEPTPDDAQLAAALEHARQLPVPTAVILGAVGLSSTSQGAGGAVGYDRVLLPVPALAEQADTALANVTPDAHGTIRAMPLLARVHGVEQPTLGLAAMAKYLRRPGFLDPATASGGLQLAGRSFPVDASDSLRINFFGGPSRAYDPSSTFRVVSFVDVLRGRVDPNVWRNGLVFVGALGATGLADDYWTPVSTQSHKMAGVEIHANVAATVFSTQFVRDAPPLSGPIVLVALVLAVSALSANLKLKLAYLLVSVVLAVAGLANAWAAYNLGVLVPLALPMTAACTSFVAIVVLRLRGEACQRRRHDALTGLANRLCLMELMRADVRHRAARGLLLLDMDRFKDVNDTFGHATGDQLLRDVAGRLMAVAPRGSTLARLGGDEFAVWLPDLDGTTSAQVAQRITTALSRPFNVAEREIWISASVGVSLHPVHGDEPTALVRRAELAMYAAKGTHGGWAVFSPHMDRQSEQRLELIGALPGAIMRDELLMYVQPKLDCQTGALASVEALLRWNHPVYGLVLPDRFVGLAEESGLIGLVTRWMVETAVRQARRWLDAGLQVPIAVNLSRQDFGDPDIATIVAETLRKWEVPASLLTIEITETAVLAQPAQAMNILTRLGDLGVRASLDDFGTGFSSLSAIQQLPLHELKIDRSFVCDLVHEPRDRAIVRSTIQLGHSLGLKVVAEGVEDAATFGLLRSLGCDLVQGYHFARPMPAASLEAWLQSSMAHTPAA